MKERIKEFPPDEQTVAPRTCIFKEFMGPEEHVYVRTMGLGLTPSQVFGKASTSQTPIDESIISSKLESLVKEKIEFMVSIIQSQIDKLNNFLEEMASLMENLNAYLALIVTIRELSNLMIYSTAWFEDFDILCRGKSLDCFGCGML
ncbi:hypothetical protein M9H77_27782 [Catharanthus roseus]|uniref:Uncharacterized protein n=1 Tax=Catharanthus roseus TaxID=4058 RepID=A0ACC0ADV6_CATRO|nr:hypothetical protein M9H77_27782 [Catharanthus roseus]